MANLNDLLTPKAGDKDIPALRGFLAREMSDTRGLMLRVAAEKAFFEGLGPEHAEYDQGIAQKDEQLIGLLAKYNDFEARLKALPADPKPVPARANGAKP